MHRRPDTHDCCGPPRSSAFETAMAFGELKAESRRHTEILLSLQERLIDLPDRISDAIELAVERAAPPAPPSPPPASSPPERLSLGSIKEWLAAAAAICALVATILGKTEIAERLFGLVK